MTNNRVNSMEDLTLLRQKKDAVAGPASAARQRRDRDRGQGMLEFALMLPFLMLIGVGVAEIGRAIYYTVAVNNAAVAGAEYGSRDAITASEDANIKKAA